MAPSDRSPDKWREHRVAAIWTLAGGLIFMGAAPLWLDWTREHILPTALGGTADVAKLDRGCPDGWQVVAQNEWTPVGTAVRKKPNVEAEKIDAVSPNIPFLVDGWVHASVPYPNNPAPFDSDVWLHRKRGGWVSFAGVRAVQTRFDPTLQGAGSFPAPLPDDCAGAVG